MLFFCRLVREITGTVSEGMRYTASVIATLQHAAENFLVDLFEHSNVLAIHAKRVTILPSNMQTLKRVTRRFDLEKGWF